MSGAAAAASTAPRFDLARVRTPAYVIDLDLIERNLRILTCVQEQGGCKVLLSLKAFAAWIAAPLVRRALAGCAAASLHESILAREHFGGELHVYSAAYTDDDFPAIAEMADYVYFNSFSQWQRLRSIVQRSSRPIRCGIRINPEHSEVATRIYDPSAPGSRLGVTRAQFREDLFAEMDGILIHNLCELDAGALERTVDAVEHRFAPELARARFVNLGGGHQITRPWYDVERLLRLIARFRERWQVEVYLEPGEAIAADAGYLVATVVDVMHNELPIAILDASAVAHMPDVLEMPYRPAVSGAGAPGELPHTFRLAGNTCLAGDVIGDYSFEQPLRAGDRVCFMDMAHYTMVKNTTFNGVRLPSIATFAGGKLCTVREFGYTDYRDRLS